MPAPATAPRLTVRQAAEERHGGYYFAGPAVGLPGFSRAGAGNGERGQKTEFGKPEFAPAGPVTHSGKGTPSWAAPAPGRSLTLEGKTVPEFDGGRYRTAGIRTTPAEGCKSCSGNDPCVRVRGVLVARYRVATTVTLPRLKDYPDLTRCQRRRVKHAIDTVLAPHERKHVKAFKKYNGVTRTPFDLTLCRGEVETAVRGMFEEQEAARRADAQAASDALDPFNITVDLDCDDK